MKKEFLLLSAALLLCAGCSSSITYKDASAPVEKRVEDLLSRMTREEKILQASQYICGENDNVNNIIDNQTDYPAEIGSLIYFGQSVEYANHIQKNAVENTRLGIPVLLGFDVIHGYRTIFPIPLAQGCSWNPEMVRQCCSIAATEAYSSGLRWTFSPMIDIARDPRWGRVMEGYGEDPYATSVFCRAAVEGYQGGSLADEGTIAACLKHYVGYGASEAGRDYVPTDISDQTLRDTYFPPYKAGVEAGAATVMSSFNTLNGTPTSGSRWLLTDVLRGEWGFDGFVVSDWEAVMQLIYQGVAKDKAEAGKIALEAGVDMDMVDWIYRDNLDSLIRSNAVKEKTLDEAVRRILTLKFRLGLFDKPYTEERPEAERFLLPEYRETARAAAGESMVLLKNEGGILPLSCDTRVAVVGPFADSPENMNGNWTAKGRSSDAVSILSGVRKEFSNIVKTRRAEVVICCIGQPQGATGENCSYSTIDLPEDQEKLVIDSKKAGKKVVVLLTNGRPLALSRIEPYADAILETWHLGSEAGNAICDVLCGKTNPSGKLCITFPYTSGQIPIYYNRRPRSRNYDMGVYQDITIDPLYEFGHGLSYSSFNYSEISLAPVEGGKFEAKVTVTNDSKVDGSEAVLWFVSDPVCRISRPVKELKFFEKKMIPAGESREFVFEIDPSVDLAGIDAAGKPVLEKGDFIISCGPRSATLSY